jgi:malate dehydrogenase (oxaloacetate-decarboxylating)(NADP+)
MSLILLDQGPLFIADTHINAEPTPDQVAKTVIAAARHVRRFGIEPQIAVCSSSQFGNLDSHSGRVMRGAMAILDAEPRDFIYEGEMQTDAALNPEIRLRLFPRSRMTEPANVLIYANSDAAGATRNLMKSIGNGLEVGPILMGMGNRAHIVTPAITVRGLINVAALAGTEVASYG